TLLARIHEISTQLRPTLLDDLGLKEAIQSYLSEYERVTGILPQAVLRFDHANVSTVVSQNVFRIVQEALTNVAKHSRATEVQIELHVTADQVTLSVRDDGVGFAPAALDGRRLGMLGMRERAELLDGSFSVRSAPGKGTQLAVNIPIRTASSGGSS
ncbi:MAG TPA: sensor histidine kinase, partial [Gemmataceae bacterium]|nr:sensor histidine kinase [Gemmataceae bacterium]